MHIRFLIFFLTAVSLAFGQRSVSYNAIDYRVAALEADSVSELAIKLTSPYGNDEEKVRAIFSWIAQHIRYRTRGDSYHCAKNTLTGAEAQPAWKSGDEMTADIVLKNRVAVCDGYAKLFKTLCKLSGIPCEAVTGFARGDNHRSRFSSNHTWNAVYVGGKWQLVDVTWGSGYLTYGGDFVPFLDDVYFFAAPDLFIADHYPEDLRWTFLSHPVVLKEFQYSPFRPKSFIKYGIRSFFPAKGVIKASLGDTLHFIVELEDAQRIKRVAPDPFFDPLDSTSFPLAANIFPTSLQGNQVEYSYILSEGQPEWINLILNEDEILRYRLLRVVKK
ncbi:MAG: hypothetical protein NVS9B7_10840 [Flavisolibacter sp.]